MHMGDLEALGDGLGLGSVGVRTGLSPDDGPIPRSTWNPALAMGVSIEEGSLAAGEVFSPTRKSAHKRPSQQATNTFKAVVTPGFSISS